MTDFTTWHGVLFKLFILLGIAAIVIGTRKAKRGATYRSRKRFLAQGRSFWLHP
jgi:hypothetical protein